MRDTELNRAFKYFADDVIEVMNGELDDKADLIDGKIPSTQLPSYVDDTIEGYYYGSKFYEDAQYTTEITGEAGKIYVDISSNKSYRWTGSVYTRIDECPAFGEIQGTIYEGNKGKANADAIAAMKDGQGIDSFGDVETALAGKANTSDLGAAAAKGFDASPTSGNTDNTVSSDGVYQALVPITAEFVELVDSGAKNFLPVSSGSATNNYVFNDLAVNIPAGKYIFVADIENYGSRSELVLGTSGGSIANVQFNNADSVAIQFDVTGDATSAKLYTMGGTFTNMMLCTKSAWDISHKFVPYCPSMAEMYAMIQALQT